MFDSTADVTHLAHFRADIDVNYVNVTGNIIPTCGHLFSLTLNPSLHEHSRIGVLLKKIIKLGAKLHLKVLMYL